MWMIPIQRSNLYPLNAHLAEWAYAQTRTLNLGDDPKVAAFCVSEPDAGSDASGLQTRVEFDVGVHRVTDRQRVLVRVDDLCGDLWPGEPLGAAREMN